MRDRRAAAAPAGLPHHERDLKAWGWRIPFVIGALLALVALVMRRNLHETDDFVAAKKAGKRESSIHALLKYPREVALVVGLTMGGTTAFYTYTTYMQKFLKLSVGLTDNQTTLVTAASLIFALFLQPIYGALSDRIGRKPLLIWFGVTGVLFTIPLLTSLQAARERVHRVPADRGGLADRRRLHLDQRRREGGAVSDRASARPASACPMRSPCRSSAARRNRSRCGSSRSATRPGSTTT